MTARALALLRPQRSPPGGWTWWVLAGPGVRVCGGYGGYRGAACCRRVAWSERRDVLPQRVAEPRCAPRLRPPGAGLWGTGRRPARGWSRRWRGAAAPDRPRSAAGADPPAPPPPFPPPGGRGGTRVGRPRPRSRGPTDPPAVGARQENGRRRRPRQGGGGQKLPFLSPNPSRRRGFLRAGGAPGRGAKGAAKGR